MKTPITISPQCMLIKKIPNVEHHWEIVLKFESLFNDGLSG